MKKKILIPTDFSKNAWNATTYAIDLFKREHCEFHIVNTYFLSGYSTENLLIPEPGDAAYEVIKEASEKNIEKLKTQLNFRDDSPGHRFYFYSEFGTLTNVIKKIIDDKDIEFIVMGTRGETDSNKVVFGSNTITVMEKIRLCPVLAIPGDVIFKDPNEIVFPTSFKTHFKQRELKHLIEIARLTNAPIRILHMKEELSLSDKQKENKQLLEDIFHQIEFTHHELENISVKKGLQSFVQSRGSEMIAFINKKHTFFGSIFTNPMVKELGAHAKVPILALHDIRS